MPNLADVAEKKASGRSSKKNLVDRLTGAVYLDLMLSALTDGNVEVEDVFFFNDSRFSKQAEGKKHDRLVTANLVEVRGFSYVDGKVTGVDLTWYNLNPETLEITLASEQDGFDAVKFWDRIRDAETVLAGLEGAFGQEVKSGAPNLWALLKTLAIVGESEDVDSDEEVKVS